MAQQPPGAAPKMVSKQAATATSFTDRAAQSNIMEIELGKLATMKATDSQVKRFAQRMVDDHSKAGDELDGLAAKDNFVVPAQLDPADQMTVDRLSRLSGGAFDRAYMREMVMDHENAVMLFQREASKGTNADVKFWAASTLPTLQDHLREAREIENRLVGGSL